MKIMLVILKYDYNIKTQGFSLEYQYFYKTLKDMGHDVLLFDFGKYIKDADRHDRLKLKVELLRQADKFKPNLMLFSLYNDEIGADTLDYLKKHYTTINWFSDDNWRFNDFTIKYASHFTHCVTTDKYLIDKYKAHDLNSAILSQWACLQPVKKPHTCKTAFLYDVSFIGGVSHYRRWFVKMLDRQGIKVHCFGSGWKNGRVSYDMMAYIMQNSRININIPNHESCDIRYVHDNIGNMVRYYLRPPAKNVDCMKARPFEIAGAGGFVLNNYIPSIEDYLMPGKEIAIYNDVDDAVKLIRYYLKHEDERNKIRLAGHRCVVKDHTFKKRFTDLFTVLKL